MELRSTYRIISSKNKITGIAGEVIARYYLAINGHVIIDTNWRSNHGELDLITIKDQTLNFIEIKTSRFYNPNYPNILRVNLNKQQKIKELATEFRFKERKKFVKYSLTKQEFIVCSVYLNKLLNFKKALKLEKNYF